MNVCVFAFFYHIFFSHIRSENAKTTVRRCPMKGLFDGWSIFFAKHSEAMKRLVVCVSVWPNVIIASGKGLC